MHETAYENVRNDKKEETWALFDYEDDKSDKLKLTETGTGDIAEFASKLVPTRASYGFVRVKYSNDEQSTREKFLLVVWLGENVKVMRKAKVSVHVGSVKSVIRAFSMELKVTSPDELKEDVVVNQLRRLGANYDRSKFN
ncbi:hypothetical protein QFC22_002570 [Naganishia vaughanmartiniae]|uniref:Uncharacterized protein n=1 Tax=Naganishia vaughanmartiniae TaxID=1424756 RepID=A0ACC2XC47_9TREE|nr:hypothetical protein QFC22_002570 [Naganishia vaughanmartiniae]